MKKLYSFFILSTFLMNAHSVLSQVVINEIDPVTQTVELKNIGETVVDVSGYFLCSFPTYNQMSNLTLVSGDLMMVGGSITVVSGHSMGTADDELGLYDDNTYTDPAAMMDYVEWGFHGHQRSGIAEMAFIWEDGDFIPAPGPGQSMAWDGTDDSPESWDSSADPTFGEENSGDDCIAQAGDISTTGATTLCVGDGSADEVEVTSTPAIGSNIAYVITDEDLNILDITPDATIDFDGAEPGVCLIWNIAYEDDFNGEVGMNVDELTGCFDLSNESIEVNRIMVDGAEIATDDDLTTVDVVVGDDLADVLVFENTSTSDEAYVYIITEEDGTILGSTESSNDFEGAEAGVCLVYGLSYAGELNLVVGENIDDVNAEDCYELSSNTITINREQFIGLSESIQQKIEVYPSSASRTINLSGTQGNFNVEFYTISGRLVETIVLQGSFNTINVSSFDEGIYIGRIAGKGYTKTFRFAKTI